MYNSRGNKECPQDTVKYEIYMLRFCFQRFSKHFPDWTLDERRVYVESYLLHFRNLIEFLGSTVSRDTDLKLSQVLEMSAGDPKVVAIQGQASELHTKYWTDISQYLQHLTDRRHREEKSWAIDEMFRELNPILKEVEELLP